MAMKLDPIATDNVGKTARSSPWPPELADSMAEALQELLTLRARKDLELRVRSGTGTEDKTAVECCAPTPHDGGGKDAPNSHAGTRSDCSSQRTTESPPTGAATGDATKKKGEGCHEASTSHCCGDKPTPDCRENPSLKPHLHPFRKDGGDTLGELLDEWTTRRRLRELAAPVAERSASVYRAAIERGKRDGMSLPGEAEAAQLRRDVTTEALLRTIHNTITQEVRRRCMSDSHEGGLLANPGGYRGGHLDFLLPETIRGLMVDGVGVQDSFVGEEMRVKILRELEFLEFDGAFSEIVAQNSGAIRTDSMCWRTLEDLDREKEPGLMHLFRSMGALPFELNKKANLCLQASWTFHLACYSEKGAYYKKHKDGGFDADVDNGRKITCIYYPNARDWDCKAHGGALRLYARETYQDYRRQKEQSTRVDREKSSEGDTRGDTTENGATSHVSMELPPKGDCLVVFRSREVPHEVIPTYKKRFAVSLWITGPAGPGDN